MNFFQFVNPAFSLSGLIVGALVGMTGVGGGALMTPLLVLLFGVHPTTAIGTDLLYAALTKTVGTGVHGMNKTINWRIVGLLASGSLPSSIAMLWVLSGLDRNTAVAERYLSIGLGWALLLTVFLLLFRGRMIRAIQTFRAANPHPDSGSPSSPKTALATVVLGGVLGVLVTLTSVGAGALGMTVILMLYPRLQMKDLVGTDIMHAVPLAFVGGIGYWAIGNIDWAMLVSLLIGSIPGIIIGSRLAPRLPDKVLRPLLAVILTLVGVKLVWM